MSEQNTYKSLGLVTISQVANRTSTQTQDCLLKDVIGRIKDGSGGLKERVEKIRATSDKAEGGQLKVALPAVLFSGRFSKRASSGLMKHSGLICLDFDNLADAEAKRNEVALDEYVVAAFISPSGYGLKVLFSVPDDEELHLHGYNSCVEYMRTYGLEADQSGKDIARLCFLSYDPSVYFNPDAYELPICTPEHPKEPSNGVTAKGDRVGDRYNAASDIFERSIALLTQHGWKRGKQNNQGTHFTRPNKERGVSGILREDGSFYCFTDNAPPLAPSSNYDAFALYTTLEHSGDFSAAAKALLEEFGDPNQHISGRDFFGKVVPGENNKINLEADELPHKKVGPSERPRNGKEQMLKRPPVLLDGLLYKGDIGIIGGAAKAGKTIFAMNLAVSLAKGESFLSWENSNNKYKVLYLDFELAEWMIDERINAITEFDCPENLTTVSFKQFPHLASLELLKKYVEKELVPDKYDLIIWDCLYRFIGGRDENDNGAMAEVFSSFQQFGADTGATQLIIHHFGKGDHSGKSVNDCFRGASAITGAVDCSVALSAHEEKNHFIVKQISRGFEHQDPFVVHRKYPKFEVTDKDPTKHRRPGAEQKVSDKDIVDCVTALDRPTDAKSIGENLQLTQQQAKPRLDELVTQGRLKATEGRPRKYSAA